MASASRSLYRSLLRVSMVNPAKRKCLTQGQRPFTITTIRGRDSKPKPTFPDPVYFRDLDASVADAEKEVGSDAFDDEEEEAFRVLYNPQPSEYLSPETPLTIDDLTPDERADYEALSQAERSDYLPRLNHYKALSESEDDEMVEADSDKLEGRLHREHHIDLNIPKAVSERTGAGYWADDEVDELAQQPDDDDEWDPSMITSVAENELQLHREIRQYTRAAAWEMPLLTKLVEKAFEPPKLATPLRFRYTTYMGESHPAARKVVVEFTSTDLAKSVQLTPAQRVKLTKLLGPRYNPTSDTARLSCEKFENAAQNKRYLGDLVSSLIREAKEGQDLFEDVPRDERHVKVAKKVTFPAAWLLKEKRVAQLQEVRRPKPESRNVRDTQSQSAVAEYMQKMPLGRAPLTSGAAMAPEKVPEREPVVVR